MEKKIALKFSLFWLVLVFVTAKDELNWVYVIDAKNNRKNCSTDDFENKGWNCINRSSNNIQDSRFSHSNEKQYYIDASKLDAINPSHLDPAIEKISVGSIEDLTKLLVDNNLATAQKIRAKLAEFFASFDLIFKNGKYKLTESSNQIKFFQMLKYFNLEVDLIQKVNEAMTQFQFVINSERKSLILEFFLDSEDFLNSVDFTALTALPKPEFFSDNIFAIGMRKWYTAYGYLFFDLAYRGYDRIQCELLWDMELEKFAPYLNKDSLIRLNEQAKEIQEIGQLKGIDQLNRLKKVEAELKSLQDKLKAVSSSSRNQRNTGSNQVQTGSNPSISELSNKINALDSKDKEIEKNLEDAKKNGLLIITVTYGFVSAVISGLLITATIMCIRMRRLSSKIEPQAHNKGNEDNLYEP